MRWQPPIPKKASHLLTLVLEDHQQRDIDNNMLPPVISRIAARADHDTLIMFARRVRSASNSEADAIMWCFYMHALHRRTPVSTALRFLMDRQDRTCTAAAAVELETHLTSLFHDVETTFDASVSRTIGIAVVRRMIHFHEEWAQHAQAMVLLRNWTVVGQQRTIPRHGGIGTKYIRGHHLRAMALLAEVFRGRRPLMHREDWNVWRIMAIAIPGPPWPATESHFQPWPGPWKAIARHG